MQNFRQSFRSAWNGLVYCFSRERNMKIHGCAAIAAIIFGYLCDLKTFEWGLLILAIMIVLIAEIINTAIEKTADLVTENYHPLARIAKNAAAGAVLLAAINSIIMGIIIFSPYILVFLKR